MRSILENAFQNVYQSDFTASRLLLTMVVTTALALYIFCAYRIVTRKSFYSKAMNISLAAMPIITAAVILTVQSSLVISLGMVGALSIVRFRTAIKDPMDLVFLFWSLSTGIICGAGLAEIAVWMSLTLTLVVAFLSWLPVGKAAVLLVVNADQDGDEDEILRVAKEHCTYQRVKSRNYTANGLDMVVEVRTKAEKALVKQIKGTPGVYSVSLVEHDGEATF